MSATEPSFGDKIWKKLQSKKLRPLERELIRRTIRALDSDLNQGGSPEEIAKNSTREAYVAGEIVLEEGSSGDAIYILLDGALEILLDGAVIEKLRPGEVFGEIAMLTGEPRTATVRAGDKTVVLRIPQEEVDQTLRTRLWDYAAERRFINLHDNPEADSGSRQTWYLQARHSVLSPGSEWDTSAEWLFLYAGKLMVDEQEVVAPRLISGGHIKVHAGQARVAMLPPPPSLDEDQREAPIDTFDLGRFR